MNGTSSLNSSSNLVYFSCQKHITRAHENWQMETSRWKFVEESSVRRKFDPYSHSTLSTQKKLNRMKETERMLDEARNAELLEKVEQYKQKSEPENIETKAAVKSSGMSVKRDTVKSESIVETLKKLKPQANHYLMLVNKLDEEEGIRTPSMEDKLNLAEDRLRVSTMEFCKTYLELISMKDDERVHRSTQNFFITPDDIHSLFRSKIFDPSTRPPRTTYAKEYDKTYPMENLESEKQMSKRKLRIIRERHKQGFYLPAKMWFAPEKQMSGMTHEEVELLNSTATRAFLKFLEKRKKGPPKILQSLKEKLMKT
ncbi:uncharacterized protein LOC129221630 isoform X2 [Uloborus diversus]|uniref:uncharacterized protein LOC129221630 isoform X2 n=1 Tax=Uloborus diversus TaxID=327109 RepID=UPI002409BE14|nr:uncharacterized protein LOC129221630 isoform X2 [Uloborus diversus]